MPNKAIRQLPRAYVVGHFIIITFVDYYPHQHSLNYYIHQSRIYLINNQHKPHIYRPNFPFRGTWLAHGSDHMPL